MKSQNRVRRQSPKWGLWVCLAVAVLGTSCQNQIGHSTAQSRRQLVLDEIERCPAWAQMNLSDPQAQQKLRASLEKLSRYETADLRNAEVTIHERYCAGQIASYEHSKLFVINRYLFNVPPNMNCNDPYFGGWLGVPDGVDMLWPLQWKDGVGLVLVGKSWGYCGEIYSAVNDFDWLNEKFGRRKKRT